jgi:16S rRNA (cytosine967-C5)-methyltransferase
MIEANNAHPPQSLRLNLRRVSREPYVRTLASVGIKAWATPFVATGVVLENACDVERLPGFAKGVVSVQDPAAQLAAVLLDLRPNQRILDACAAPGGKTCHVLESEPELAHVIALDRDAVRLGRIRDNLERLGLTAQLLEGDASNPQQWWDGMPYDRILLDAPCSATGVIRRHPDIKLLRKAGDIERLATRQQTMMARLWPLLAPGGMLVYATCSVLKRENEFNVGHFLATHTDARERPIAAPWGHARACGRQILPGEAGMDGFYYACLVKEHNERA